MFSGKSEELIRRLKRAQIAKRRVACFKPDLDVRYHRNAIASHSAQTLDAVTVANVEELKAVLMPTIEMVEVVGIDEAQFFDGSLVSLADELVRHGAAGDSGGTGHDVHGRTVCSDSGPDGDCR